MLETDQTADSMLRYFDQSDCVLRKKDWGAFTTLLKKVEFRLKDSYEEIEYLQDAVEDKHLPGSQLTEALERCKWLESLREDVMLLGFGPTWRDQLEEEFADMGTSPFK